MRRILVTGASGFVGTHLVERLKKGREYDVFASVFGQSEGFISNLLPASRVFPLNLMDAEQTRRVVTHIKPQAVVHLAALAAAGASFDKPVETLVNNIGAQVNLLEALVRLNSKPTILIIGSGEEYGMVRKEDLPIDEETPLRPVSPYAVSKVAQDFLGYQYYLSYQLPVIRLRPFNHTGERQTDQFVVPAFAKQIAEIEAGKAEGVLKVGNLQATRDFTDVKDMVIAYELALTQCRPGEVYNIGSGRGVSINQILRQLMAMSKVAIRVEKDRKRFRKLDVPMIVADNRRFRKATGWKLTIPLAETLTCVLDYWRGEIKKSSPSSKGSKA